MTKDLITRNEATNFLIYTTPNGEVKIEAFLHKENIWLTQKKMAELFGVGVPAIFKHLENIYLEGELDKNSTISNLEIVQKEGNYESKKFNASKELLIKYKTKTFFATHNPANKPDKWNDWIIHGHCHNKNLEKYSLINGVNKTINVSCELLDYKPISFDFLTKELDKIKYWKTIKDKPIYFKWKVNWNKKDVV